MRGLQFLGVEKNGKGKILVEDVDHALGVRVAKVGVVRYSVVDHGLVDRVRRLVGEDARGQARHDLLDVVVVGGREHVGVDGHVDCEKVEVETHVAEEAADHRRQVDDVRGLVLVKDLLCLLGIATTTKQKGRWLVVQGRRRTSGCRPWTTGTPRSRSPSS